MLIIDGHEFDNPDSALASDGRFPPFYIFDSDKQRNIAGPFDTRAEAESVLTVQILNRYSDNVERLRLDMLFDPVSDPISEAPKMVQVKYLQALALLEQARHVMKEAALHAS